RVSDRRRRAARIHGHGAGCVDRRVHADDDEVRCHAFGCQLDPYLPPAEGRHCRLRAPRSVAGGVRVVRTGTAGGPRASACGGQERVPQSATIGPLLYDARAGDASTLAAPGVIMIAVSILAALPPVVRATRVNPVEILRAE